MIHLEKLAFLLLIAAGALIYVTARKLVKRKGSFLEKGSDWLENHLSLFLLILFTCVLGVSLFAALDVKFPERPVVRHLNTPFFVKVPLALLCGALFIELALAVKKTEFTALYLAIRAVPFVFFFTIGFFSYELQQTLRYLTRIEAGGITLDFASGTSSEAQPLIPSESNPGGGDIRTAFQLGISLLPEAFGRLAKDSERIKWCDLHPALNCGGKLPGEEDNRTKTDAELANEQGRAHLENLYTSTQVFLDAIEPLQKCLSDVYVKFFPNGSPIQEELSDFAVAVSIDYIKEEDEDPSIENSVAQRKQAVDTSSVTIDGQIEPVGTFTLTDHQGLRDFPPELPLDQASIQPYLKQLGRQLRRFGRYANQYKLPDDLATQAETVQEALATCRTLRTEKGRFSVREIGSARSRMNAINVAARTDYAKHQKAQNTNWKPAWEPPNAMGLRKEPKDFSLPYMSILEAAIIASSGYPEEAARHMVREYTQLTSAEHQQQFGIKRGGFSEFLLQVRLLSPLEQIFAYSNNKAEQIHYAEALVSRVDDQLKKIEPFKDGKRSNFISYCAAHRLFPPGAKGDGIPNEETRQQIETYFRSMTYVYLRSYARLLEAVATDPRSLTWSDARFNRYARVAEDLGELASDNPSALSGCLSEVLRASVNDSEAASQAIELLRYDLLAAYGFILARQADQREIDPEIAPNIDRSFKQGTTCKAQRILLEAWRLRHVAERQGGGSQDSVYAEKAFKIRRILEQINRSGVDCFT
ncbi:MAG: hypothetical protein Tsb0032_20900 [Kiloniellaceae bacterium]